MELETIIKHRHAIQIPGWLIFAASIVLFLASKSPNSSFEGLFWVTVVLSCSVSTWYLNNVRSDKSWWSKNVRTIFSPYMSASIIWVLMLSFIYLPYAIKNT